jgi:hypothetical protein
MSRELHKKILEQAREDGWSQDADVDLDTFAQLHQARMALYGPTERMRLLNNVDAAIGEEDGTRLRAKSDLLRLRRSLSHTHEKLLKAGR